MKYFILYFVDVLMRIKNCQQGGRDSSVGKSSASHAGDLGSNPSGGLTQVTQCMNERERDYQL